MGEKFMGGVLEGITLVHISNARAWNVKNQGT